MRKLLSPAASGGRWQFQAGVGGDLREKRGLGIPRLTRSTASSRRPRKRNTKQICPLGNPLEKGDRLSAMDSGDSLFSGEMPKTQNRSGGDEGESMHPSNGDPG